MSAFRVTRAYSRYGMKTLFARCRSALWFLVALVFLLLPKRAPQGGEKKILIIQMAKLGDMVCTTPMFRAFKQGYPKGHLFVMGNSVNREVLEGNPYVDEYLVSPGSVRATAGMLYAGHVDAVCITGPGFEQLVSAIIARVPLIVIPRIRNGKSPYESLWYKILSRFVCVRDHRMETYAPREYLKLLEPLGIMTSDTKKEVYFSETAKIKPTSLLNKSARATQVRYIGILPGAGNEIKSWAPEKFGALMNMITKEYEDTVLVLLGAGKDRERAEVIESTIHSSVQMVDCIGKLSIDELKACISMLDMVIGADTGPQYIAEALNIPTIDIVGPCDEREQPPMGDIHMIVKVDRVKPELYVMNARSYNVVEAKRQVESITPVMVYEKFMELLQRISELSHKEKSFIFLKSSRGEA